MIVLDEVKLNSVVKGFYIPSKPALLTEITEEIDGVDPCLDKISQIISKDINLSALLLKTINSPVFGLNRTISDIRQAALFLGLEQLKLLVTATLLRQSFSGDACISLERFWDESLEVANTCTCLGKRFKSQLSVDELYSIGLFHNVGIAAMALRYSDYVDTLRYCNSHPDKVITKVEQNQYQCDHATIGYFVAVSWHLPQSVCNVILHHHDPLFLSSDHSNEDKLAYAILKCAENAVDYGRNYRHSDEWLRIKSLCFAELGIADDEYTDLIEDFVDSIQGR